MVLRVTSTPYSKAFGVLAKDFRFSKKRMEGQAAYFTKAKDDVDNEYIRTKNPTKKHFSKVIESVESLVDLKDGGYCWWQHRHEVGGIDAIGDGSSSAAMESGTKEELGLVEDRSE